MKKSAGILAYRKRKGMIEYLLIHPGGPFWKNKDLGSWSIPKGEFADDEDAETAARREFQEETGFHLTGKLIPLKVIRQKSGKWIHAFAINKSFDAAKLVSNTFELEWPPRSGRMVLIPETDRAAWFDFELASQKILSSQLPLLIELNGRLNP